MQKTILHLCADTGSDTKPWRDAGYEVILVGKDIGVENFTPPQNVFGIIANPVCLEFSTARSTGKARNPEAGLPIVRECQRIIEQAKPEWWVIENPAKGVLKEYLGKPTYEYEPWWYGSPWTKRTALWGEFKIPPRIYHKWDDVPKIPELYTRPGRSKPGLAFNHARAHMRYIPEFAPFYDDILKKPSRDRVNGGGADMEFRSLCSQKFAQAFFEANK